MSKPDQTPAELHAVAWKRKNGVRRIDGDRWRSDDQMRCKETRAHWLDKSDQPGPSGQRVATTTRFTEKAVRTSPDIPLAAYMVKEHWQERECSDHVDMVVAELTRRLIREHRKDRDWEFYGGTDKLALLASLIVESWANPAKYFKDGVKGSPKISVFSRVMDCDRKTWHSQWKGRYEQFSDIPEDWYHEGRYRMTGQIAG